MTITLCGFALSNYYNKVKLVLLEKGIAFEEELVPPGLKSEAVLAESPLGKVPYIRTAQGALCESAVIVEYLEQIAPEPRLLPADPFAAAKVRELAQYVDLHLELVVRDLYPQAFFGGAVSESSQARVRKLLDKNIPAFKRLAQFKPYLAGETFTLADCAGYVSLPLVALATKLVYGEDLLATYGVDWKSYVKLIAERPSAQRVDAERKVAQEQMKAAAAARS
jgi:glutathione S-transferase